nr:ribonuclease E/G [Pseudomonadota bacterium]
MTKRMLVDATHPEETRVAIVDGNWLSDFDFERASKKQLKGNIYLAKVIRIEPSLQAAFVEYGGNRHGFLPFSEIHPDYFRIPMADRPHEEEEAGEEDEDADDAGELLESIEAPGDEAEDDVDHLHPDEDDIEHVHALEIDEEIGLTAAPAPLVELPADSEEPILTEISVSSSIALPTLAEFGHSPPHDLGLITDFGNAIVTPVFGAEPPVPVETVGGEPADEERYRRPPRPRYKIQEVIKRRQVMLIQVVKEERGNKGAALTTFLSLAGRYCVLMPNTESGGGVSRKITSHQDRRRMKEMLEHLEVPEGMAIILRTAGMEQEPPEIQRDLEYLLRLWNNIREQTLQSTAPALIYEEANLIKRSMRDLYAHDVSEILVAGAKGYQLAIDFMRAIMPDQLDKVKLYEDPVPLFFRFNVEKQIDQLYNPTVQLRSGGYIVINPTEALVSIDVNSGRATRERHIESTALKTNLEAAEEVARQLRLRDLAGLIVIDFIDMEDGRNNAAVERRMKESMRVDRARLQIGRISPFGLLELSRQRLRPSLTEINFEKCPHCVGLGLIRSVDSAAISILRMIEEEGIKQGGTDLILHVPSKVALYILNQKRAALSEIERRYTLQVLLHSDESLVPPDFKLERGRTGAVERGRGPAVNTEDVLADIDAPPAERSESWSPPPQPLDDSGSSRNTGEARDGRGGEGRGDNNRRRGRNGRNRSNNNRPQSDRPYQQDGDRAPPEANGNQVEIVAEGDDNIGNMEQGAQPPITATEGGDQEQRRSGRRRGRRGGRGRRSNGDRPEGGQPRQAQGDQGPREPRGDGRGRHEGRPPRHFD